MNSSKIIKKHYERYIKDPIDFLNIEEPTDIYKWNFALVAPKDTPWEDEIYNGVIEFPSNYPFSPPVIKFAPGLYHPNVYKDGKVCISILHEGVDETNYEDTSERWSPVQTIQTIFLSIISLFHSPNCDSPANVDASILYRKSIKEFTKYIRSLAI
jgi:ubiquitin-conjugating enzyme E2 G1